MSARYAVFFCPEDGSDLAVYGQRVLGRTAAGLPVVVAGDDTPDPQTIAAMTATPAHYGFHATLKAPFHLSHGTTEDRLLTAVHHLAGQQTPVVMHALRPAMLSGFAALCFDNQPPDIVRLAGQCVEELDIFRAPLTQADLDKRNPERLNESQRAYLFRFGYPYVMSEFRFHMTLTGAMNPEQHADYFNWLQTLYIRLVPEAPTLDRLAVFWQPDRRTAFIRLAEFPFPRQSGSGSDY